MSLIRYADRLRTFVWRTFRFRTLGANVLALDPDEKVLLIRQTYGASQWVLPGGGLKHREHFREAALRELREEVGVHLDIDGTCELFGVYLKLTGGWTDHIAVYIVRGWTMDPVSTWEVAEWRLFSLDALPANVSPGTRHRLAEFAGRQPQSTVW